MPYPIPLRRGRAPTGASAAVNPGTPAWKQALAEAVRDSDTLLDLVGLPDALRLDARRAAARFPLLVPRGFIARMKQGDPGDPLLRQVLPLGAELEEIAGFAGDPVADRAAQAAPGLLQKYDGRVLLIANGVCAVHCRYCFRREYPYHAAPKGLAAWRAALDRIAADSSIHEVILSGGDPLLLGDDRLRALSAEIAAIPAVTRLRIHSRLPIVLPERIDDGLLGWLRGMRLVPYMVVHANHPAELIGDCAAALERLVDAGIPVLNQAVLLRGVNDDVETLVGLCERLADLRVLSYYLHQLDRVRGAAHFLVEEERGRRLYEELRRRVPGHALPRWVREDSGAPSKTPLA